MNRNTQRGAAVSGLVLALALGGTAACGHKSYNTACAASQPTGVTYVAASSGSSSSSSGSSSSGSRSSSSSSGSSSSGSKSSSSGSSGSKSSSSGSSKSGSSTTKSGSSNGSKSGSSTSKSTTRTLPGGTKAKVDSTGRVTSSTSRHSAAVYGSSAVGGGYRPSQGYHVRNGVAYPFSGGVLLPAGRPYPIYSGGLWSFPGYPGLLPIGVYPPGYLGYSC